MSPEDLAETVATRVSGATGSVSFGQATVDVGAEQWREAAELVRDDQSLACRFFDWLSAYDAGGAGLAVVVHVWSTVHRHHLRLRTHVARDGGRLASLTGVWPGANWHERETFEMFGVVFDGHPNLVPLLLPDGFEGHPLRKEFVLASRVAKGWPGAKEPGESDHDTEATSPGRRRMLPPGVPDPTVWGPDAVDPAALGPDETVVDPFASTAKSEVPPPDTTSSPTPEAEQ
jgi:NADH-quinone oxidoreductase subunit C